MVWKPLQPDHAIERVRIIVHFRNELPTKFMRKLAADNEELRLELGFTSKNLREGQQITLGPVGVSVGTQPNELLGWDWQKLSPANSPLETLVVEKNALVYETAEYSGWQKFINRFEVTALPSVGAISDVVEFLSVSLEYVDRFVFEGEATAAAPDSVLKDILEELPPEAASGKELWHIHRGWFEHIKGEKFLINQNIDAQDGQLTSGDAARSLQVFTKTELRIGQLSFDYPSLRPNLENMHNRSKELFRSILTTDMQNRTGLG